MPTSATSVVVGMAAVGIAGQIWRRWMRERRGVVVSLRQLLRVRHLLRDASSLLLIVDFDRTITTSACGTLCHGVVESCQGLSVDYREGTKALFEHPIETDHSVPVPDKIPIMQEWYRNCLLYTSPSPRD